MKIKENLACAIKIIRIYRSVSPVGLLWIILLSIFIPLLQSLMLVYTEKVGDSLAGGRANVIIFLLFIQSGLYCLTQLFLLANNMIENKLNLKYNFHLNTSLKEKLSKIKIALLDDTEMHNRIVTVQHIIPQIGVSLLSSILTLLQTTISILGMIYILRNIHFSILILLVLFSLVNILISNIFNKVQMNIYNTTSEDMRKKEYYSQLFFNRELMSESRMFQLHKFFLKKWEAVFWKVETPNVKLMNRRSVLASSIQISINLLQLVMLIILVNTSGSALSVGTFILLTQAILQIQGRANELVASLSHIHQTFTFLPLYFEVLNLPEEEQDQGREFSELKEGIVVSNLSFKYINSSSRILEDVTFSIKKGERVAIVGHNGSGKTTLVKCMLGLYDEFLEGSIYYDGLSISDYNKDTLRNKIAVLFQNYGKYPLSFKENVIIGDLKNRDNEDLYNQALKSSNSCSTISSLPNGSNTSLGPEFNKGIDMSGGQWQKTALARVYFRDADIVFLDEPTSAIDPVSENEIYKHFFGISKGKTSIILTHRLGMCKWVDKIIVLEKGRIKEIGTHNELLNKESLYREMFLAQSEWYIAEENMVE
ncbi:ABC transporter ATP-binding protein [Paenibacillus sp. OK003]|uniref:ABC transporter ATP-binding protein n=1 Tax=Paenibacillus sp. OK003 TaxID=1884380 RepID=UPI0008D5EE41|nr:ABC transporter ATP-binding protein [Paenibacillus sp. OK003]SEK70669.1 ATP-binding cassette, subfamily B/ATP-binding cassette, subfamily C [Paenibacillus sp. OK003]